MVDGWWVGGWMGNGWVAGWVATVTRTGRGRTGTEPAPKSATSSSDMIGDNVINARARLAMGEAQALSYALSMALQSLGFSDRHWHWRASMDSRVKTHVYAMPTA